MTVEEINAAARDKLRCFLPFHSLTELARLCHEILADLKEYQSKSIAEFNEAGIEFGELTHFGIMIDADQPNVAKYISMPNDSWKQFIDAFVDKYKIQDPNNTIKT